MLKGADDILVLTHKNPDGDAIGSALAVCAALRSIGKRCNAAWTGPLSAPFRVLTDSYEDVEMEPRFLLAVDIASESLLPDDTKQWAGMIDLCIDHHASNTGYAACSVVNGSSSSCAEMIMDLLPVLGAEFTEYIGECIYVGLSTDTGCFKYSNTNADSHITASRLAVRGVDIAKINDLFFEQKTRGRIEIERLALDGMEFTYGGRICIITVTRKMMEAAGCIESDIEDLAGIPKSIMGVECGLTLKEQKDGSFRISVRTKTLDASAICRAFGGGGHIRAAGCECTGTPFDIKVALISVIRSEMDRQT